MKHRRKTVEAVPAPAPVLRLVPPLEGVELPPFTAAEGTCSKCSAAAPKTKHFGPGQTCNHGDGRKFVWGLDRLHRTCKVCGFSWDEAVIDNGEA